MTEPVTPPTLTPPTPADPWALLGLPRSAVVQEDAIRTSFQTAAAAAHPDKACGAADREARTVLFARLNEARATLLSVPARLRALRALEFPGSSETSGVMSGELMDLFARVGAALQAAQQFARKKAQSTSALARALLAPEEMTVQENLQSAAAALDAQTTALRSALPTLDSLRATDLPAAGELLATLLRQASFLEKWQSQVRGAFQSML